MIKHDFVYYGNDCVYEFISHIKAEITFEPDFYSELIDELCHR